MVRRLEADTNTGKGAGERRKTLVERRRQEYREVIKSIVEEENILNDLYLPLRKTLNAAAGTLAKLADVAVVIEAPADLKTPLVESFQAVVWHALVSHPDLAAHQGHWESLAASKPA